MKDEKKFPVPRPLQPIRGVSIYESREDIFRSFPQLLGEKKYVEFPVFTEEGKINENLVNKTIDQINRQLKYMDIDTDKVVNSSPLAQRNVLGTRYFQQCKIANKSKKQSDAIDLINGLYRIIDIHSFVREEYNIVTAAPSSEEREKRILIGKKPADPARFSTPDHIAELSSRDDLKSIIQAKLQTIKDNLPADDFSKITEDRVPNRGAVKDYFSEQIGKLYLAQTYPEFFAESGKDGKYILDSAGFLVFSNSKHATFQSYVEKMVEEQKLPGTKEYSLLSYLDKFIATTQNYARYKEFEIAPAGFWDKLKSSSIGQALSSTWSGKKYYTQVRDKDGNIIIGPSGEIFLEEKSDPTLVSRCVANATHSITSAEITNPGARAVTIAFAAGVELIRGTGWNFLPNQSVDSISKSKLIELNHALLKKKAVVSISSLQNQAQQSTSRSQEP